MKVSKKLIAITFILSVITQIIFIIDWVFAPINNMTNEKYISIIGLSAFTISTILFIIFVIELIIYLVNGRKQVK